ncbi:hypothetical protein AAFF_G00332040 [Aldrovandia affinis]|uniref:Uncharacterized protein n=1 Tax=Aldrovandia affinis TaxID=143900 RepID=A0AAD7WPT4_9TELE|nr:hypothetical protein AAFF_G00332040 [Aldrovandia affinis]
MALTDKHKVKRQRLDRICEAGPLGDLPVRGSRYCLGRGPQEVARRRVGSRGGDEDEGPSGLPSRPHRATLLPPSGPPALHFKRPLIASAERLRRERDGAAAEHERRMIVRRAETWQSRDSPSAHQHVGFRVQRLCKTRGGGALLICLPPHRPSAGRGGHDRGAGKWDVTHRYLSDSVFVLPNDASLSHCSGAGEMRPARGVHPGERSLWNPSLRAGDADARSHPEARCLQTSPARVLWNWYAGRRLCGGAGGRYRGGSRSRKRALSGLSVTLCVRGTLEPRNRYDDSALISR